jgi:ABC-type cobalamin/Fe3+-siderophores transport system ATPase subunit
MFFIRLIFGLEMVRTVDLTLHTLSVATLVAWTVLLSADGEVVRARKPATASEERLLAQLESINESLLRSARK